MIILTVFVISKCLSFTLIYMLKRFKSSKGAKGARVAKGARGAMGSKGSKALGCKRVQGVQSF